MAPPQAAGCSSCRRAAASLACPSKQARRRRRLAARCWVIAAVDRPRASAAVAYRQDSSGDSRPTSSRVGGGIGAGKSRSRSCGKHSSPHAPGLLQDVRASPHTHQAAVPNRGRLSRNAGVLPEIQTGRRGGGDRGLAGAGRTQLLASAPATPTPATPTPWLYMPPIPGCLCCMLCMPARYPACA